MRKYLEKRENGAYYIAEGYNEFSEAVYGVKWVNGYAVYAACEKQEVKKLESYIVVNSVGELIGKGGGLWSKHTSQKLEKIIG